jgi:HSP20 family molecular chaperone IbpA
MPPVDIHQTGDRELVLTAELPDMAREDIGITIENFVLTLTGEKKHSSDVKQEQLHHVERRYGTFSRSFSLPQTVDGSKVSAEYKNGVLTVDCRCVSQPGRSRSTSRPEYRCGRRPPGGDRERSPCSLARSASPAVVSRAGLGPPLALLHLVATLRCVWMT